MTDTPTPDDGATDAAIITTDLVRLDATLGSAPSEVIGSLAALLAETGRATDPDALAAAALEREGKAATGLPGGIAIPHCRSAAVTVPSLAFARLDPAVNFGATDGPADIVFLIAAPEGAGSEHMKVLTSLARALVRPDFVQSLRDAGDPDAAVARILDVVRPAPAATATPTADPVQPDSAPTAPGTADTAAAAEPDAHRSVVAITACPTGIAHTYMAADALTAAAERTGVDFSVETQGSSGSTPLSAETIAQADAVIFATDVGVKARGRFAGKPVISSGVKRAINEPDTMIAEALAAAGDPHAPRVAADDAAESDGGAAGEGVAWGRRIQQVLMTGVSYMIPFVAAGGLLMALGFLVGGYEIADSAKDIVVTDSLTNLPDGGMHIYLGAVLFTLGSVAMSFLVPALSGYIAFGIADRPGIAPGFTAGAISVLVGAGFIGGLVGGVVAGLAALAISKWRVPEFIRGLMPVVIIPLLATLIAGGLMLLVLGRPLAAATEGMENFLGGLTGASAALLGVLLGLMMCFDLGGPVNKAAYAFAVAGLSVTDTASMEIMAAVMLAGMVPPLAMALSSLVRPALYTPAERQNGKAAWLLGLSFISEGAIPFAAADPLRVIPSMMLGGAVTGALSMIFGVTLKAPHGGVFVAFAVGNLLGFFVALVAGTAVAALAVTAAKQFIRRPQTSAAPVTAGALA
ncbi:PTS fructose transporter subunit IIABC [Tomitella cavernea]|uniref:Fructose-specific PTS transporter subunit EIIC n=1 Tax=Tomitella cavernea TaxID=1387982 RepID=A0ABP9CTE6_9ACTN|nr:fructose-specific PTS transporter subunit EIIC [Tomitella cavernea]